MRVSRSISSGESLESVLASRLCIGNVHVSPGARAAMKNGFAFFAQARKVRGIGVVSGLDSEELVQTVAHGRENKQQ